MFFAMRYPKVAVPEMGKFTQKWFGLKWVKILLGFAWRQEKAFFV